MSSWDFVIVCCTFFLLLGQTKCPSYLLCIRQINIFLYEMLRNPDRTKFEENEKVFLDSRCRPPGKLSHSLRLSRRDGNGFSYLWNVAGPACRMSKRFLILWKKEKVWEQCLAFLSEETMITSTKSPGTDCYKDF